MSKNLLTLFEQASEGTQCEGANWYRVANKICTRLASEHDIPLHVVAQVMSALSPACSWERNIQDTESLLLHRDKAVVCTYGKNKAKALRILAGQETMLPKSKKTYAFYRNIMLDADHVTIDRHAYKALVGGKRGGSIAITPKRYEAAQRAYVKLAKRLNLIPYELQAIIWLTYKEIN